MDSRIAQKLADQNTIIITMLAVAIGMTGALLMLIVKGISEITALLRIIAK